MKRDLLYQLNRWKTSSRRKPLIVEGARQVGKTYLLMEFGKAHFQRVHYLNFEERPKLRALFEEALTPAHLTTEISLALGSRVDIENDLLFFDEIQACPNALTSLKYFCEKMPQLAVVSAGSLLGLHLGESSYPVGKVDHLHLYPLSFREFLEGIGDEFLAEAIDNFDFSTDISNTLHAKLWERLKHYFITGGMPEVVSVYAEYQDDLFTALQQVRAKQKSLVLAYLADIAKHSGKENAMHIERVLASVPSQLDRSIDGKAARYRFSGVVPGITRYSRLVGAIDWLERAGLIYRVHMVDVGTVPLKSHYSENRFKLLMLDVGLLGCMVGLSPQSILAYDYGSFKGYFAENFIAQELVSCGVSELIYWQEKQAELDFVLDIEGQVVPLEVKSGRVTKARSLAQFAAKYHPKTQVLSSGKPLVRKNSSGRIEMPLYLVAKWYRRERKGDG